MHQRSLLVLHAKSADQLPLKVGIRSVKDALHPFIGTLCYSVLGIKEQNTRSPTLLPLTRGECPSQHHTQNLSQPELYSHSTSSPSSLARAQ